MQPMPKVVATIDNVVVKTLPLLNPEPTHFMLLTIEESYFVNFKSAAVFSTSLLVSYSILVMELLELLGSSSLNLMSVWALATSAALFLFINYRSVKFSSM